MVSEEIHHLFLYKSCVVVDLYLQSLLIYSIECCKLPSLQLYVCNVCVEDQSTISQVNSMCSCIDFLCTHPPLTLNSIIMLGRQFLFFLSLTTNNVYCNKIPRCFQSFRNWSPPRNRIPSLKKLHRVESGLRRPQFLIVIDSVS